MTTARFPDVPASVPRARDFIADALSDFEREVRNRAVLITSELATNAIRHAHSPFRVTVALSGDEVRVAVTDRSGVVPIPQQPSRTDAHGRGLMILRTLADRWGIDTEPSTTTVWFTLALTASRDGQGAD
jgi:anti-sigma regulatory factor (Ser/Thr protein kinase)